MILSGIGIYGLILGPRQPSTPEIAGPSTRPSTAPLPADPLPSIAPGRDPIAFAESVALVIFDWDTARHTGPTQIIEQVAAVADPTGYETPGLYQDLRGYLPTDAQWQILGDYATAQTIEIDSIVTPDSWADIAADPDNEIAPGTLAVNITGIRTRSGGWDGEIEQQRYPVAFTMFLRCGSPDGCSVLRLSELGATLP